MMYKLNPKVISVGAKGNKILRDHNTEYPASFWDNGVADELVEKGFLVRVETAKAEPTFEPKVEVVDEPKATFTAEPKAEEKPKKKTSKKSK
jgi:hypothetical protein